MRSSESGYQTRHGSRGPKSPRRIAAGAFQPLVPRHPPRSSRPDPASITGSIQRREQSGSISEALKTHHSPHSELKTHNSKLITQNSKLQRSHSNVPRSTTIPTLK